MAGGEVGGPQGHRLPRPLPPSGREAPRAGKAALSPAEASADREGQVDGPGPQGRAAPTRCGGMQGTGLPAQRHLGGQGLVLVLRQVLFPEDQGGGAGSGDGRHPVQGRAPGTGCGR